MIGARVRNAAAASLLVWGGGTACADPGADNAASAGDWLAREDVRGYIRERVAADGFDRAELEAVFRRAVLREDILERIARPVERTLTWPEYRRIFLKPDRVRNGVEFLRKHAATLARAEATYGVPPEVVVAILGVETAYGRITGGYAVLDALVTLGFAYPPRAPFFRRELTAALRLAREERVDIATLSGSYAGAMGVPQFMPSSYRAYAVDFDGDGRRDIWATPADAIGSVAAYLSRHGWRRAAPVGDWFEVPTNVNAELGRARGRAALAPSLTLSSLRAQGLSTPAAWGDETKAAVFRLLDDRHAESTRDASDVPERIWIGLQNFYVVTRYNHSHLYALAVIELARAIRTASTPE